MVGYQAKWKLIVSVVCSKLSYFTAWAFRILFAIICLKPMSTFHMLRLSQSLQTWTFKAHIKDKLNIASCRASCLIFCYIFFIQVDLWIFHFQLLLHLPFCELFKKIMRLSSSQILMHWGSHFSKIHFHYLKNQYLNLDIFQFTFFYR